jgi:putative two-component system response regulator
MIPVLVVDDYEANLTLYARVIQQIPDTQAFCFTSSKKGLAWAEQYDPALLVLDQNMPEPDGLEMIRIYRAVPGRGDTPIIMITGSTDREIRREAMKRGASAFLQKPVDPVEFLFYAKNLLTWRQARLESALRVQQLTVQVRELDALAGERDRAAVERLQRALEARDKRSYEHGLRVGLFAERIARAAGWSENDAAVLAFAARVHDIGKIAIPDRVFYKNGRLQPSEREIVNRHAAAGETIVRGAGDSKLMTYAADIASQHHENFDGTGYPRGLKGDQINEGARVVAVADRFAATTSHRPWRDAVHFDVGVNEIVRMSGTAFDPKYVTAFREALSEIKLVRSRVPDLKLPA